MTGRKKKASGGSHEEAGGTLLADFLNGVRNQSALLRQQACEVHLKLSPTDDDFGTVIVIDTGDNPEQPRDDGTDMVIATSGPNAPAYEALRASFSARKRTALYAKGALSALDWVDTAVQKDEIDCAGILSTLVLAASCTGAARQALRERSANKIDGRKGQPKRKESTRVKLVAEIKADAFLYWSDWKSGKDTYASKADFARYVKNQIPDASVRTIGDYWCPVWEAAVASTQPV